MDPQPRHRRLLVPAIAIAIAVQLSLMSLATGPATLAGRGQSPAAAVTRDLTDAVRAQDGGWPAPRVTYFHGGHPSWTKSTDRAPRPQPAVKAGPTPAAAVPNVAVAKTTPKLVVAPKPATTKAAPKPVVAPKPATTTKATAATYSGRNHIWIPALGVNQSVSFYACSRSTALANVVYRWGCAGSNNVYLMGHAHSVFRSLHNAYVNGQLRKGMQVIYADGNGRVTKYAVTFWKVVSPIGAEWAFASQSQPSLTLQTCVGSNSERRLVVRLVAIG
jgi:sortase (surface protein transpeptidase)